MPTVLRVSGFSVRIYLPTREHGPAHVHVLRGNSEVVILLNGSAEQVSVREVGNMPRAEVHRAVAVVEDHAEFLRQEWRKYHG